MFNSTKTAYVGRMRISVLDVYLRATHVHVWHPSLPVAPSEYPVLQDNMHSTVDMQDLVGAGFGASVGASIENVVI